MNIRNIEKMAVKAVEKSIRDGDEVFDAINSIKEQFDAIVGRLAEKYHDDLDELQWDELQGYD